MGSVIKILFNLYYYILYYPLALSWMVLSSISAILVSAVFGQKAGSYMGRIWAQGTCVLSFVRVRVIGRENLSETHSYVFVANHSSSFDIYSMYGYLGRDIRWMMKKELMRTPFLGFACKMVGHIAVDRSNPKKAAETIVVAKDKLKRGTSVIFFPEGSRTRTGQMGPFKRGAFVTAQEIGLPIVPVSILGSFKIMRPGTNKFKPGTITIKISPPCILKSATKEEMVAEIKEIHDIIEQGLQG